MARPPAWTADDIPDLEGRTALVTGANSGLGYETSLALARRGAHVILACRDAGRAEGAIESIRGELGDASLESRELDLAQLASVRKFAEGFLASDRALDILCNNAGVMALPYRRTADGFEMQIGTNHLGHFALTGLLLPRLLETPGARVVTVSSTMHKIGRMHFEDLHWERRYWRWAAYGQSKLANLLFTYELERRLERRGARVGALASHPGYAATNLQTAGAKMDGSALMERGALLLNRVASQSAAMGALPSLYAATSPEAQGGDFIGPGGPFEVHGPPAKVRSSRRSHDREAAATLWEISRQSTDVGYEALG